MNLRTKKTIAKEILYFFFVIIVLLISWAIIEIQNSYHENKITAHKKEINQLQIQINEFEKNHLLKPDKLKKLNENAQIMFEAGSSQEDILKMKNDFIKRFGNQYSSSEKIKLKKLIKNEELEKNELKKSNSKILNSDDILYNLKIISILLFGLIYPIRIIFIAVKWAIKTLKIKN